MTSSTSGPLTPNALVYGVQLASDPQIAPDATRIAYTVGVSVDGAAAAETAVWLCRRDGSGQRMLSDRQTLAGCARWSPDGARIAFTTTARGPGGSLLVAGDPDGDVRRIATYDQPMSDLAWSPDGRKVAWTALADPAAREGGVPPGPARVRVTRRIDYKDDGRGYLGDTRNQLFVTRLDDGRTTRLTSAVYDHNRPRWSPDGRHVAVQVPNRAELSSRLVLIDSVSGGTQPVSPANGTVHSAAWSPDGLRILYACDLTRSMHPDYFLWEMASDRTRRLAGDLESVPPGLPDRAPDPVWLDDRRVLLTTVRRGASQLEILDTQTGAITLIARTEDRRTGLSADQSGRYIVQAIESLTSVGEISLVDLADRTGRVITALNGPLLSQRPPARWEKFQVPRGEFLIDAWLLHPPGFDPANRYPVILDVHGGPNSHYGYGFQPHQQCLASHGFLVLYANPRGSTSYGGRFSQAVVRDWGGGDLRDLLAVLDDVLERPYADAARTGIYGYSYGGYVVAWAISQTNRFRAAVCGAPIFDLESDYGTSDIAFNGLEHYGEGAPHTQQEWYVAHSPSTFAHRTTTPTLIIHGEADARCPIGQGEQMFTALKKARCETEFARYPDASHMFFALGAPDQREDFLTRVLAWFQAHLGTEGERDEGLRPASNLHVGSGRGPVSQ